MKFRALPLSRLSMLATTAIFLSCLKFGPSGDGDTSPEAPPISNDPITGIWKPASLSGSIMEISPPRSDDVNGAAMTNPFPDSITGSDVSVYLAFGGDVCTVYVHYAGTLWYGRTVSPVRPSLTGEGWSVDMVDSVTASLATSGVFSTKTFYRSNGSLVIDEMTQLSNGTDLYMLNSYAYWAPADAEFPPPDWPDTVLDVPMTLAGLQKRAANVLIPSDQCNPRPCECADLPMIDLFQRAQSSNLDAWESVRGDLFSGNPPTSAQAAKDRYNSYATSTPGVMPICLTGGGRYELGAISPSGGVTLDQCMCDNYCDIIANSVSLHERAHIPANISHFFGTLSGRILARAAGSSSVEGWIDAANLATAEIDCHMTQIAYLSAATTALELSLDSCTWQPLPKRLDASVPASIGGRAKLLASRMLDAVRLR